MEFALAVDIGGTKMAVGVVDENGLLQETHQAPNPSASAPDRHVDAREIFAVVADLVGRLGPFDRFSVCGVGCGGPMSADGALVSPLNIPGWRAFPLAEELERLTGLPTRVDNDAKALALGEGWVGAAVGERNFIAMVVSTGVGGGIVLDGRLLDGAAGNAGHIGHVVVEPDGNQPPRQIQGTLEAEASGTSIAHRLGRPSREASTADITRTGTLVGRAIASTANLLDLRLAVIGGSVALGFGEPFFTAAQTEVDRVCALDYSRGMRVEPVGNGADGPLIGAGAVGFRHLGRSVGLIAPP